LTSIWHRFHCHFSLGQTQCNITVNHYILVVCLCKQGWNEFTDEWFTVLHSVWPNAQRELKWIEMDSDFQKYEFMNVKMNSFQFWMHFYSFIGIACLFQSKNNISIFCMHIVNTTQFRIVKHSFFNSVELKNNISNFCATWILLNSIFWIWNAVFQLNKQIFI